MDPTDLINYQNAIKSIESSGGNYGLTGPVTRSGDRAYGAYQVMGSNIPAWTEQHYGQALNPQQFLANKEAQDAVFNGQFGSYVQQHGNPQDAASMWFTGRPQAQGGNSNDGYITGNQYVSKFNKALGYSGDDEEDTPAPVAAINKAAGAAPAGSGTLNFGNNDDGGQGGIGAFFGAKGATKDYLDGMGARLTRAAAALSSGANPAQSAQLSAQAKSLEAQNKTDFQYSMGPNGQLVKINKDTGEVSFATLPGAKTGNFVVVPDKTTGQPIGRFDKNTGQYTPFNGQNGGQQAEEQPTTIEDLQALNPLRAKAVQQVLDGSVALPKVTTRSTPENRQLRNDVLAIGGVDEGMLTARNTAFKNLNNKSASQLGGQLTQLGHSGDIMAQLGEDGEALHNSGYRLANSLPASIGNNTPAYQEYAGKTAAFDQKADGLIGELSKLYNGSQGGGVTERAVMRQNTPRASDPPEIIASKVQALRDLYESRMHEMKQQIAAPFGGVDSADADRVLSKYLPSSATESLNRTAASIERLHTGAKAKKEASPQAPAAPAIPSGWKVY